MSDFRWQPGDVGCTDLVDEAGVMHGYIMPVQNGRRGVAAYVILPGRKKGQPRARFLNITQHPTHEAARAWVEIEVRRLGKAEAPSPVENEER